MNECDIFFNRRADRMQRSRGWIVSGAIRITFSLCCFATGFRPSFRRQAVNGWIEVPKGPGLGVTLDEDFVREYLVSESGA